MTESYRALLARGQTTILISGLGLAWLSFGMVGLAIFLTTHRATGSYGLAGLAVAAFSLGSGAVAPLRGRVLDRRGTRPWLFLFAAGYAAGLFALAALEAVNAAAWLLMAFAAVSGAGAPPLVATLRAAWPSVVEESLVRRAYALTSIVGDVGGVAAPALGGLLFVLVPWLPLAVCATAAVAAALVAARVGHRPVAPAEGPSSVAPLLSRGLLVLFAAEVALGAALGLVEVAVPAAAAGWDATAWSGALLGAFALGSVIGGIWFGRREWRGGAERRYLLACALLAATLLLPIAAGGAATLAPLLLVAGLAFGPATISLFEALDDLTTSRATEAFTWITTSAAAGTAAGSAAAGWATESLGLWAAFAAGSAVLGVAAVGGLRLASPPRSRTRP